MTSSAKQSGYVMPGLVLTHHPGMTASGFKNRTAAIIADTMLAAGFD
jgi:hypothetical protein